MLKETKKESLQISKKLFKCILNTILLISLLKMILMTMDLSSLTTGEWQLTGKEQLILIKQLVTTRLNLILSIIAIIYINFLKKKNSKSLKTCLGLSYLATILSLVSLNMWNICISINIIYITKLILNNKIDFKTKNKYIFSKSTLISLIKYNLYMLIAFSSIKICFWSFNTWILYSKHNWELNRLYNNLLTTSIYLFNILLGGAFIYYVNKFKNSKYKNTLTINKFCIPFLIMAIANSQIITKVIYFTKNSKTQYSISHYSLNGIITQILSILNPPLLLILIALGFIFIIKKSNK